MGKNLKVREDATSLIEQKIFYNRRFSIIEQKILHKRLPSLANNLLSNFDSNSTGTKLCKGRNEQEQA
jgi:hypothetical protein